MNKFRLAALATAASCAAIAAVPAHADTMTVEFNVLNAAATLNTPFAAGDSLILDTLVTQETGALSQSITFTVAAGVTSLVGQAVWAVSTAAGPGPRLVGVNIDIFDAGNNVVLSDSFSGVLGGFAISTFNGAIGPGTYRMVAVGNGVRDSVLDVAISMVPEPGTYALMLGGLGAVGLLARRRRVGR
jgi:hypothetical protein